MMRHRGLATTVRTVAVLALLATASLAVGTPAVAVATPVLLASPDDRRRDFLLLVSWILGGALAGGAIGWGLAQATAPTAATISAVFGAAIGGGFAAVIRLFVFGDTGRQEPESVTVDTGETDARVPDPEPIDLFEGSPDPILYFDDAGDGPVVRAANPAYEAVFGVDTTAVENAALGDALMVTDRTERLVDAAAASEQFDDVIACETGQETVRFRVRTTTTNGLAGTRGYVLYTPVDPGD